MTPRKASVGSLNPAAHIERIAGLGFAGIEDKCPELRSPADQERVGRAFARRGHEMGCFVNNIESWNKPLWNTTDPSAQD